MVSTRFARRRSCSAAGSRAPASITPTSGSGTARRRPGPSASCDDAAERRASARRSSGISARSKAVLFGGFDEADRPPQRHLGVGRHAPGRSGRPRARSRRRATARRWSTTPSASKIVLYGGNTGTGARDRRHLGRRDLGVGRDRGDLDARSPRPAAPAPTTTSGGYTRLVYDPRHAQDRPLLLLQLRLDYTSGSRPRGDLEPTRRRRPRSTPPPPCYYNPALVYDSGPPACMVVVRRPVLRPGTLWELNTDATVDWTNRSAPANGPIQRQYPSMAFDSKTGKLIVFGGHSTIDSLYKQDIWEWSGTDATLTNRTTGDTKPDGALPGGDGLRQQARSHAAVRRLRRRRPTTTSGPWAPATRDWTQITVTGARPAATLRPLDVLRRRPRQGATVRTEPAVTRSGSTTRR